MAHELKIGEYRHFDSDSIVNSGVLRPCSAVFIYNPKNKELYAGHFVDEKLECLEEMVKESVSKEEDPKDLEVYIAGCSYHEISNTCEKGLREKNNKRKQYILDTLTNYGLHQIYGGFGEDNGENELILDTSTGKATLKSIETHDL